MKVQPDPLFVWPTVPMPIPAADMNEGAVTPVAAASTELLPADASRRYVDIHNDTSADLLISETGATLAAMTDAGTILRPDERARSLSKGAITYRSTVAAGKIRYLEVTA